MISESKHNLFIERMKKHIKKNNLTNELLAEKLNYSEHAVKRWLKKKEEHFPNMDKLVELSEIFDVDVAYLLGEQECEKIKTQRIVDLTGLSEESADRLKYDPIAGDVINEIVKSKHFDDFARNAWKFARSHYMDVTIKDRSAFHIDDTGSASDILKFNATTVFTKILEEMYEKNQSVMDYSRDVEILRELFIYIDDNAEFANENPNARQSLLELIALKTQSLNNYTMLKNVPDLILDNYKAIAKQLEIEF